VEWLVDDLLPLLPSLGLSDYNTDHAVVLVSSPSYSSSSTTTTTTAATTTASSSAAASSPAMMDMRPEGEGGEEGGELTVRTVNHADLCRLLGDALRSAPPSSPLPRRHFVEELLAAFTLHPALSRYHLPLTNGCSVRVGHHRTLR